MTHVQQEGRRVEAVLVVGHVPFEGVVVGDLVEDVQDGGYAATSTLAGSRIRSDIRDLGSSISITTSSSIGSPAVLDNIVVSAVPVPAAFWLFGSATGED